MRRANGRPPRIAAGIRLPAPVKEEEHSQQRSAGQQGFQHDIGAHLVYKLTQHSHTIHEFSRHFSGLSCPCSSDIEVSVVTGWADNVSVKPCRTVVGKASAVSNELALFWNVLVKARTIAASRGSFRRGAPGGHKKSDER